jgi:FG-GAP-like repeat
MKKSHKKAINSILQGMMLALSLLAPAVGQNNPVPQIVGPVHPDAVPPGGGNFTLSVYGANFVPGAVVNWNYQPRTTTYISGHEVQAQILASDIANNTAGYISVVNPPPGGGNSSASWAQVEVHDPISTILVNSPASYDFGFWALAAADFTHHAIPDLVGEYFGLSFDQNLGNGTFQTTFTFGDHYVPTTPFAYGDFNGDGNLDVAFDDGGENAVVIREMSVWLGDGAGNFSAGPTLTDDSDGLDMAVAGDFNQDGKLDLITRGQHNVMTSFLGNGDGSFTAIAGYPYSLFAAEMLLGDFNGDGKLDVVLVGGDLSARPGINFRFMAGNGDGTFQPLQEIASFPGTYGCAGGAFVVQYGVQLSDFNGDGKLDLAFCTKRQVGVMLGNGDGTFQPPIFYTTDALGGGSFTRFTGIGVSGLPQPSTRGVLWQWRRHVSESSDYRCLFPLAAGARHYGRRFQFGRVARFHLSV